MSSQTIAPQSAAPEHQSRANRRQGIRIPTLFSLLYSGMDSGLMLIGDGIVTNLSASGVSIRGNRLVTPGMELALFVNLPGVEEPLCIGRSRVSWVAGPQFGVELGVMELDAQNHLGFFLWDHETSSDRHKDI